MLSTFLWLPIPPPFLLPTFPICLRQHPTPFLHVQVSNICWMHGCCLVTELFEACLTVCNACRLRVSLSAAHTADDVSKLAAAIQECNLHFLPMNQVLASSAVTATIGKSTSKL